jgi:hypothetical protein
LTWSINKFNLKNEYYRIWRTHVYKTKP